MDRLIVVYMECLYCNLDNDTVKIEALKINFLSAFREAYKYLDPNTPEKNIIPAGSSYLYTLNSIQALRKEISDMKNSAYGTKLEYLNSMEDYADYWYNNLRDWTENAFRYPYRHTLNSLESWETLHNFDNPNIDIEKFDSMTNVVECVDKNFERNYTGNFHCEYTNLGDYMNRLNNFMKTAQNNYGTKNSKLFPALKSAYERLYYAYKGERWLDVINTSLLLTRRAHEMTGYEGCYDLKYAASDKLIACILICFHNGQVGRNFIFLAHQEYINHIFHLLGTLLQLIFIRKLRKLVKSEYRTVLADVL